MITDDRVDDRVVETTQSSGEAVVVRTPTSNEETAQTYDAPQLFVAGKAKKLMRGKIQSGYKDTANDWWDAWPKGPNNPL